MIRTVVIEDEHNSRELLINMLNQYCDNIEVVGEADNVKLGAELIKTMKPELVFMDIEIRGGTGFDILEEVKHCKFALIFLTGYEQYAIKAIKYAAIGYLLKPIELNEIKKVVDELSLSLNLYQNRISFFLDIVKEDSPSKILLCDSRGQHVIYISEITFLTSDGNYTKFVLDSGNIYVSSYPLKYYHNLLSPKVFFRIHKSYLININKVIKYDKGRMSKVFLKGDHVLNIATRRKADFVKVFKEHKILS
ncbi:MAG: LytTR family DNA-binding domain-containing protein [Bacteroidota bacterium]